MIGHEKKLAEQAIKDYGVWPKITTPKQPVRRSKRAQPGTKTFATEWVDNFPFSHAGETDSGFAFSYLFE